MGAAVRFKQASVPRQQGERARLKVVQGPDYGAVYVITEGKSTLGRGEENDMMISDLKASRRHAEFWAGPSGWQVKDLGSANGLLHNGKPTRLAKIQSGDILTFGETTLEFLAPEAGTLMLVAPPKSVSQLQAERSALEAQRKRIRGFDLGSGGAKGPPAALFRDPKSLMYMAAGGLALWFIMGDSSEPPVKLQKNRGQTAAEDLGKYLPGDNLDPATARTAQQFFKGGYREYLAGNYLRAMAQFETVLQMAPGHRLATIYKTNCLAAIDREVRTHLDHGKTSMEAGKLKESRGHFESVLRILFKDQSRPEYTEAKDQLEKVNKLILEVGEGGK